MTLNPAFVQWRAYAGFRDGAHSQLARSMDHAENVINFLSSFYEFEGRVPQIWIEESEEVNAYSTSNDMIVIKSGLLAWMDDIVAAIKDYASDPESRLPLQSIRVISIDWIVCHEFFHIARSHLRLPNDCVKGDAAMGAELDADAMAAVGMYRFLTAQTCAAVAEHKAALLASIFWPVRAMIGMQAPRFDLDASGRRYPPWQVRLVALAHKLALIGRPVGSEVNNPDFDQEHESYQILIYELSALYIQIFHIKDGKDTLRDFFHSPDFEIMMKRAFSQWFKIEILVNRIQRLKKLRLS